MNNKTFAILLCEVQLPNLFPQEQKPLRERTWYVGNEVQTTTVEEKAARFTIQEAVDLLKSDEFKAWLLKANSVRRANNIDEFKPVIFCLVRQRLETVYVGSIPYYKVNQLIP